MNQRLIIHYKVYKDTSNSVWHAYCPWCATCEHFASHEIAMNFINAHMTGQSFDPSLFLDLEF